MHLDNSCGNGEKWLDSGHILKTELSGFVDGYCSRLNNNHPKISDPSLWFPDGLPFFGKRVCVGIIIGWDSEFYLVMEQVTCLLLAGKILAGERAGETSGAYSLWSRPWVGLGWKIKIPTQSKDAGWGGWLKESRETAYPVKSCWIRGLDWEKVEKYLGLSWKMPRLLCCRGLNGLGWVVK